MWKRINECEKRVNQNRQMLNALLYEFNGGKDSDAFRIKIDHLHREIYELERELYDLKVAYCKKYQTGMQPQPMAQPQPMVQSQQTAQPQPMAQPQQPIQPQPMARPQQPVQPQPMAQPQQTAQPQPMVQPQQTAQQQPQIRPVQTTTDMEKVVGKSIMGIVASVLIFISLIVFGTLVVPLLTDTAKMMLMYAVSLIFAIIGICCYYR